ncbi:SDR family oxidoreductase [Lentzea nigeriaca]|uniref:SDR family oxidoreductase n=1 Tax=Lentzea nigeriaca TaxID=1128665 RepID=UPI00195C0DA6|nr:SDR family oxidoreductase [Lentzea nigeriaca]MBM7858867.1 NAD(P)-dependent dehydrogenase (short-subunit alcohol dehydrogenase family) [Lentzea nigeriaca]
MELSLDGSVVLVTGGVRGVGLGITRAFLSAGATVVTCARRPASVPGASFVQCDVRDVSQVSELISGIVSRFGRLDVLVNNAGGAPFALADQASPRFHQKIVELNLLAPLLVSQAAYSVMSSGSIVMVSSVSGRRPSPGTAAYGAAKAGLDSLTSSLAVEWAPRVRVNALAVGMVRTEQSHLHYGDEAGIEAVSRTVPLGRLASPDEIGACAVFLASPLASYVTGATLVVHGGGEVPAFLAAANTNGSSS